MDTSLTASERGGEATSSKTADVAATRIQARARGMIDRKKVKEKRRRYGGKRRPATAAAPAEGWTITFLAHLTALLAHVDAQCFMLTGS